MNDKINESTLEARIDNILKTMFPTFKEVNIQHQKSFSIHFGHHSVLVDLESPSKYPSRAIFDILLTIEDKNIILLELKREGLKLTKDDVSQGISYARLISQMPPITLITNGDELEMYNTYTKVRLDNKEIDIAILENITQSSFKLAVNDFKEAVNTLLNKDNRIFSKIINQISENKFEGLSGDITDFSKPICKAFQIEREIITIIENLFSKSGSLVGVVGHSFSGKTSLLYQFFKKVQSNDNFLLYLDCYDHNYSILQQLANHFSRYTNSHITKDKIREWLINTLGNNSQGNFYLLIDNFNNEIPEEIKNEIIELIEIFSGINQHTLYTIDEFNYKRIAYVENRNYKTIIGNKSTILKIDELTDNEYSIANSLMLNKFQIEIEHGGHYSQEYREVRILRHLVSTFQGNIPKDGYHKILAVPDLEYLKLLANNLHYTQKIRNSYMNIIKCFFAEDKLRQKSPELNLIASGTGAILYDTFNKNFPNDLKSLKKSSSIIIRALPNGQKIIIPKIPELIAFYSISIITLIIKKEASIKTYKEISKILIELVMPIPYCDIVATGVLMNFGNARYVELFSELIQELLNAPPRYEKIKKGTKSLAYMEDVGHIHMDFDDDMDDGGFIVDFLPYPILSQVAGYPLSLVNNDRYSNFAFHVFLLEKLGSYENFLRRADARSLTNMKSYEGYDWDGVGHLISGHEGIIEPIVQSIQKCFLIIPDEIENLYNKAFKENNFLLIWRIYLALRIMPTIADNDLSEKADTFLKRFDVYFNKFMTNYFTKNITDLAERKRIREILKNIKI